MAATQTTATSVYRYYDRDGILLYVGITSRGMRRQREHNSTKEWWRFVSGQDVEHYETRPEAERRERELITTLCPPFNVQHNPDRRTRDDYLLLVQVGGVAATPDKRLPMRLTSDETSVTLSTLPQYAAAAAQIVDLGKPFVMSAPGRKCRDIRAVRVGASVVITARVSQAADLAGALLMYRLASNQRTRTIKRVDLLTPAQIAEMYSLEPQEAS